MYQAEFDSYAKTLADSFGRSIRAINDSGFIEDASVLEAVRRRTRCSWVDGKGNVCIYKPNLGEGKQKVEGAVSFALIYEYGLEKVVGRNHLKSNMAMYRDAFESAFKYGRDTDWPLVAKGFCSMFGLKCDSYMEKTIQSAQTKHRGKAIDECIDNGDYQGLSDSIGSMLKGESSEVSHLSFGFASDDYVRCGYPKFQIREKMEFFKPLFGPEGLSPDVLKNNNLVGEFQRPMAILRSDHRKSDMQLEPMWLAVTGYKVPGKGYLSLLIDSPNDVKQSFRNSGSENIAVRGVRFTSQWQLLNALSREENIKYLKPKFGEDGTSYAVSEVLRGMDGKSAAELGYKSDAGKFQGDTRKDLSPRLNSVANIIDSFKNPISGNRYLHLFGKERHVENLRSTGDRLELMMSMSAPKPAAPVVREKTFAEKIQTPVNAKHFSKSAYDKMTAAGCRSAKDILSMGEDGFREKFGTRAYKSAVTFLEDCGLSFGVTVRKSRKVDLSEFGKMSEGERHVSRSADFYRAVGDAPSVYDSQSFCCPRSCSGEYYMGMDMASLLTKMTSRDRWHDCNVFLTEDEVRRFGYELSPVAEACIVGDIGKESVVYNLADTTLAADRELFEAVVDRSWEQSQRSPEYWRLMMPQLKGFTRADADRLFDLVSESMRRAVPKAALGQKPEAFSRVLSGVKRELGRDKGNDERCSRIRDAYKSFVGCRNTESKGQKI